MMIYPGDSSSPAKREPAMIESAPATSALTISPVKRIPPSPITGTPEDLIAFLALYIALNCGTPTPATTLVVHILPGPTPTLTASTPASTRASAPESVATFQPTTCKSGNCFLIL